MAMHRSEEERAWWVARWQASGMGCERFARKHGLAPSTLYNWGKRLDEAADDEAVPQFAEVRVVGGSVAASAGVELELPNGCVIRIRGRVDEAQLSAVVRAAIRC